VQTDWNYIIPKKRSGKLQIGGDSQDCRLSKDGGVEQIFIKGS